jgi:pimeloyl-ACP methyl ester carboxylesterase
MKLIVQNIATTYTDRGTGPVILCLHGWKDSLRTFDSLEPALLQKGRVIAVDLPGFGETGNPPEAWQVGDYVQFVADFLKKLNVEADVLIGHSFGGRIIIKGVGEGKMRARKIVLMAAAGITPEQTVYTRMTKLPLKMLGWILRVPPFNFFRNYMRRMFYTAIGSDYFNAGALQETFIKIIAEDLSDYARKISAPTLLIWGKDDAATPVKLGEKLRDLIRNSRLEVFPNTGHFVHHEKATEVGDLIKRFL